MSIISIEKTKRMSEPKNNNSWIKEGLWFGIIMYIFMAVLYPSFTKQPIETINLLLGIPFWLIGGLFYGYVTKILNKKE